ncbi:MAG: ADP-ribosylglycohydrolase family protein [Deltaproteobacteria bacterium]|nr:ADP-ribosylglycohydrolase family protein [Deltaproteobacteria bacterium]
MDRLTIDRFRGCLLGLAAGDALGFPTEFRRREAILAAFPPKE